MTTTDTNIDAATAPTKGRAPTHIAYHVRDAKGGGKGLWTRIGSAWSHADGNGFNLQLDVTPLDGRVTLRVASDTRE